ncbi:MAG: hypothetical protein ACOCR1_01955 [Planctomycetota bacterium]
MPAYSRIYCVGSRHASANAGGLYPLLMQILVGRDEHQWLEPRYFDQSMRPLGHILVVIPERPDHPHALIDACIAFFPDHFRDCPLLSAIEQQVQDEFELDFRFGNASVPEHWPYLRKQALSSFRQLNIFEADLRVVNLEEWSIE